MKTFIKTLMMLVIITSILCGCAGTGSVAQSPVATTVTYQAFYDNLSPYGEWIDYPGYGHVWNPRLDEDFRPYATNGHWVSSAEGWAWASDYKWGWAAFHYGSWLYDDMYGWLWIPGYDWSPAWVTWGAVDDFYCWAPLMPGLDISAQFGNWRPHSFYWNACSREHMYDRNLTTVIQTPGQLSSVVNRITIINNFNTTATHHLYYSKGPEVQEVQKYVNQKIEQTSIKNVNRINQVGHTGNILHVYRPTVQDRRETVQQHPQQVLQPKEFRRAEAAQAKPINAEAQKPVLERSEQRINIQNLPVHHASENRASGKSPRR